MMSYRMNQVRFLLVTIKEKLELDLRCIEKVNFYGVLRHSQNFNKRFIFEGSSSVKSTSCYWGHWMQAIKCGLLASKKTFREENEDA